MTLSQLKEYITIGHEIEFIFNDKKFSITYWYPDDNDESNRWISFCEFYKETTEVKSADDLWNNVIRNGKTVGQMLESINENDIWIY